MNTAMTSFSSAILALSCPRRMQVPINPSARETCCNKVTSRSVSRLFYNHQSTRIKGVSMQKGLALGKRVVAEALIGRKTTKRETVIPDPDYRIPVILSGLAGALIYRDNILLAVPIGLLGVLLFVQLKSRSNSSLIFADSYQDKRACYPIFSTIHPQTTPLIVTTRVRFVFDDETLEVRVGDELEESGQNAFVGGKNKWKFSTFVNWELWWPNFPILVYFKETQTKPEGQVHFFPVIFNGKQLYDVMVERAGPSKNSGPK